MEILPPTSTCLDLSIAMPGSSSPPSPFTPSGAGAGAKAKAKGGGGDAAINEAAASEEKENEERPKSPKPRKKLRLTKEQSGCLEESFLKKQGLNPKEKEVLAMELRLKARQVEVWFQNRRARSKMKQTGIECDYLKRWFGVLKEQNRKLHKQVQVEELRIMKSCPRCHRSTAPSPSDPI